MRLTKIYTKIGDKGQTQLADGTSVDKYAPRIETYGDVDELNSHVGLLLAYLEPLASAKHHMADLKLIQNQLFDLGGELATPAASLNLDRQVVINNTAISGLEDKIDEINEPLQPLKNFILPGGSQANAQCHICRCVCRRAERKAAALLNHEPAIRPETQIFLNRLSDYFFVLSRSISQLEGVEEVLWDQRRP